MVWDQKEQGGVRESLWLKKFWKILEDYQGRDLMHAVQKVSYCKSVVVFVNVTMQGTMVNSAVPIDGVDIHIIIHVYHVVQAMLLMVNEPPFNSAFVQKKIQLFQWIWIINKFMMLLCLKPGEGPSRKRGRSKGMINDNVLDPQSLSRPMLESRPTTSEPPQWNRLYIRARSCLGLFKNFFFPLLFPAGNIADDNEPTGTGTKSHLILVYTNLVNLGSQKILIPVDYYNRKSWSGHRTNR